MSRGKELKALQEKFYRKLAKQGFKDIEYGREHQPRLYEPVNLLRINSAAMEYYDAVWEIFHQWVNDRRSRRDTLLAELLASQDGDTGTVRGIARILRKKRLKPYCQQSVQKTINQINLEIRTKVQIITFTQD